MSRDGRGTGLRLLGAPVQLASRDGGAGGGRRSRPRSAAARHTHTPDPLERSRRPFSADTKGPSCSIQSLLKSPEHREFNLHDYMGNDVNISPPTAALLENHNHAGDTFQKKCKELRSDMSDRGSEDTYVSLGTKIKAKAQVVNNSRRKSSNKNYLKYRDIAKKEPNVEPKKDGNLFDFKITILQASDTFEDNDPLERRQGEGDSKKIRAYEPYFHPTDSENSNSHPESLAGRVSFGNGALHSEVEHAIDTYSRRLSNKQQLSLVEEESTQDLESMPSQPLSSLSPKATFEKNEDKLNNMDKAESDRGTYVADSAKVENLTPRKSIKQTVFTKNNFVRNFENGPKSYNSFYDDLTNHIDNKFGRNNTNLSSTVLSMPEADYSCMLQHTSAEPVTVMASAHHTSLPITSECTKVVNNYEKNFNFKSEGEAHSSLECIALENMAESHSHELSPRFTCQWNKSPGHSRLLCKEFLSIQDSDSTQKLNTDSCDKFGEINTELVKNDYQIEEEYPKYLSNSINRAYTSKVIEDYKKEIQAIDSLHELTLKDIKSEVISPTPLNIEVMFEQTEKENIENKDAQVKSFDDLAKTDNKECNKKNNFPVQHNEVDISNISTRELIQNYFKVKEGDLKPNASKTQKKRCSEKSFEKKVSSNANINGKPIWPATVNKQKMCNGSPLSYHKKINKNESTQEIPLSSRIECVQNDKDIDSWMSMSKPTPRKEFSVPHNSLASTSVSDINKEYKLDTNHTVSEESMKSQESRPNKINENMNETDVVLNRKSSVLDIYSMLTEIESYGSNPVPVLSEESTTTVTEKQEENATSKDNFTEIFTFLEKVEHSANEALSVITKSAPQIVPKLESLLRLPQTELAQRHVTAALQLEERSCCIALLQESLASHKEQMINKVNNLEKQSSRNIAKVKQECEEAIKRHQSFIDQLISDKKTLNHRIEQLVEERRSLEERWRRSAEALEQRYRLELKNQHDRMVASQQVARQRWVRQKAEKIKELTVKGLEGELREIAERSSQEMSQLKMSHAEALGRAEAQHAADLERLRRTLQEEHEAALVRERRVASSRMEKQIVELEQTYCEQRARLVAELRAENERTAAGLAEQERCARADIEKWREDQEKEIEQKMAKLDQEISRQRELLEEELRRKRQSMEQELESYKREVEAEMHRELKRRVGEAAAAHKAERDREIERAIESMEAEAQQGRRELQEALRRNKEQYETELSELGETEKATLRRYQEAQARVRQTEDKCAELEATVSQLEAKNRALTEKNNQLEAKVEESGRSGEEAGRARLEAARGELEALRRTHEEQMHQLYAKVKVAVARKDSAIQALTREADKAREKITLLEQRLQQQRKDFLKHK